MSSAKKKFQYSLVEFRRNPSDPGQGSIELGMLIGFTTDSYKALGLAVRAHIESRFLDGLDLLSKAVIERRSEIIEQEVSEKLEDATATPLAIMESLAASNRWSFFMSSPGEMEVEEGTSTDAASLEKLAEAYIFTLYHRRIASKELTIAKGLVPRLQRAASFSFGVGASSEVEIDHRELHSTWMSQPKVWRMPNLEKVVEPV